MAYRVLVIGDDATVHRAFERAVADTGCECEVVNAASGEAGVEAFEAYRPALVFLDLSMPGLADLDLARAIRERDPRVPIYVMTPFYRESLDELRAAAERGLEFELMHKPGGLDHIAEVTRGVLLGTVETY